MSTERVFPRLSRLTGMLGGLSLLAAAATSALLSPGAAFACVSAEAEPMDVLARSGVAVVASVEDASERDVRLVPQAFLKGPANADPIVFHHGDQTTSCDATFESGERVLLFIPSEQSNWPQLDSVFRLRDGQVFADQATEPIDTESNVISEIRSFTGQYAVPAASEEEGATLDWMKVVIPVGAATLGVFAVSLVLMRMWHKIDPS